MAQVRALDDETDLEMTTIGCGEATLVDGEVLAVEPPVSRGSVDAVTAWPNRRAAARRSACRWRSGGARERGRVRRRGTARAHAAAGTMTAGAHELAWDGRDDGGRAAGAGLYFIRMTADGREYGARLILMR